MVQKFKNTPEVDAFLEWLAAEDAREEKQRAAIEQQRERDRRSDVSGKELLGIFGWAVFAAITLGAWVWWLFSLGER